MTERRDDSYAVPKPYSRRVRASEWGGHVQFFEIVTPNGIATGWTDSENGHTTLECAMRGRMYQASWKTAYSVRHCVTLADRWMAELAAEG